MRVDCMVNVPEMRDVPRELWYARRRSMRGAEAGTEKLKDVCVPSSLESEEDWPRTTFVSALRISQRRPLPGGCR